MKTPISLTLLIAQLLVYSNYITAQDQYSDNELKNLSIGNSNNLKVTEDIFISPQVFNKKRQPYDTIKYVLSDSFKGGELIIFNIKGSPVKGWQVDSTGRVVINRAKLKTGRYFYNLRSLPYISKTYSFNINNSKD